MDCAHSINDSHTVVRHIRKNYGIGANADIIPNLYPSDYLHTGSDIYIISDDGGSRSLTIRQCIRSDSHLLKNQQINLPQISFQFRRTDLTRTIEVPLR